MVDYLFKNCGSPKVRVIDNLLFQQDGLVSHCGNPDFDFVYGDVRDKDLLDKHIKWADTIFPLAAMVGMPACDKDKQLAHQVNFEHVAHIASIKKDKTLIYPNTNSGYGLGQGSLHCTEETPLKPISTYGVTKCMAERAVLDAGGISLRLATVFGVSPRMRLDLLVNDFVYKAFTDGYIVLFEKDFKRNYIHVQDVCQAFCHMMWSSNYNKYQGQAFNVGLSSANLSKWELCQKIKQYLPKFSIQVDEIATDVDKRNYIVSNDKLEATGWKPKVSLYDGIEELLKAYRIMANTSTKYSNV